MKSKAMNVLIDIGLNVNSVGFESISTAIELMEKDNKKKYRKLTTLYSDIANKIDSTPSRVERGIRHALEKIMRSENTELVDKYFSRINKTNGNQLSLFFIRLQQN